jgi:hypothetical protein
MNPLLQSGTNPVENMTNFLYDLHWLHTLTKINVRPTSKFDSIFGLLNSAALHKLNII